MRPTVSIVVPTYNAGTWLAETVGSVLCQSFEDYELIVVDDGSTDDTLSVLRKSLEGSGARVLVQQQSRNGGVSAARNCGADLSSGRFLLFLDADDVLTPDALLEHVKVLNDGADVSCAQWDFVWRGGGEALLQVPKQKSVPVCVLDVLAGWWVPTGALLLRREVVDAANKSFGGFRHELNIGEDVHYLACLQHLGARFVSTNRLGIHYRYSPRSVSRSASKLKKNLSSLWIFDYWLKQLGAVPELLGLRREALLQTQKHLDFELMLSGFHEQKRAV